MLPVQPVLRRVLEDLMPLAEHKQIDLGVVSAEDVQVGSERDLIALVRNLVDNAIRYTPRGGRIDLSAGMAGGGLALCVRDSGPGIPPAEERERVFDPFYRVLGTRKWGRGWACRSCARSPSGWAPASSSVMRTKARKPACASACASRPARTREFSRS